MLLITENMFPSYYYKHELFLIFLEVCKTNVNYIFWKKIVTILHPVRSKRKWIQSIVRKCILMFEDSFKKNIRI